MSTLLFVALVKAEPPAGYHAQFPDLPGCVAQAPNLAELLVAARSAVLSHLQALSNAGDVWPTPTPIEDIRAETGDFSILVDVTVDDPPVRVNISLGESLLQRLDAEAEARSMTRSGFIAQAVRVSLGERPTASADLDAFGHRLQAELTALGRRLNESLGPDSAFARRMNEFDDFVFDGVRKAADGVSAAMVRRQEASQSASNGADSNGAPTRD